MPVLRQGRVCWLQYFETKKIISKNMTRQFLALLLLLTVRCYLFGQSVGIGTNNPNASAALDVVSTTGGILPPRLTSTQRDAIQLPADGLIIFNTTTKSMEFFSNGVWTNIATGQVSSSINYSFSTPQFIDPYRIPTENIKNNFLQKKAISQRYILEYMGTFAAGATYGGYNHSFSFIRRSLINGTTLSLKYFGGFFASTVANINCFAINEVEDSVYAVIDSAFVKMSLSNNGARIINRKIGYCRFLKKMPNNDIVISTDLQNGSLIKFSNSDPNYTVIASNLDAPPYAFDVVGNDFYALFDFITGSFVKKITSGGNVSNVLINLPTSFGIVIDNKNNILIGRQITVNGNLYRIFSIYNTSGTFLQNVTDESNKLLASATESYSYGMVPLFVDQYNNLFFDHKDGNIASSNPYSNNTLNGVYKIELK
jgi:hypothetical protein